MSGSPDLSGEFIQPVASAQWYMTHPGGWHHGPVSPERALQLLREHPHFGHFSDDTLRQAVEMAERNIGITTAIQTGNPDDPLGITAGYGPFANQYVSLRVLFACPAGPNVGATDSIVVAVPMSTTYHDAIDQAMALFQQLHPEPKYAVMWRDCPPVVAVSQVYIGEIGGSHRI